MSRRGRHPHVPHGWPDDIPPARDRGTADLVAAERPEQRACSLAFWGLPLADAEEVLERGHLQTRNERGSGDALSASLGIEGSFDGNLMRLVCYVEDVRPLAL